MQDEYTSAEAASLLGLTAGTVRGLIASGKLETRRIGRRLHLIPRAEIDRYLSNHKDGNGWAKRHDPAYVPSAKAAYYRARRQRKKQAERSS